MVSVDLSELKQYRGVGREHILLKQDCWCRKRTHSTDLRELNKCYGLGREHILLT
jgi:hypothetical protein